MKVNLKGLIRERTLVIIKPDAVNRSLTGTILERLERVGLKIVACKFVLATREQLEGHFPKSNDWVCNLGRHTIDFAEKHSINVKNVFGTDDLFEIGVQIKEWNFEYLSSGPILVLVLEGVHAMSIVRKLIGSTLPYMADPGTIRGDFSTSSPDVANALKSACHNVIHASKDKTESDQEINNWFKPEEIISWEWTNKFMW